MEQNCGYSLSDSSSHQVTQREAFTYCRMRLNRVPNLKKCLWHPCKACRQEKHRSFVQRKRKTYHVSLFSVKLFPTKSKEKILQSAALCNFLHLNVDVFSSTRFVKQQCAQLCQKRVRVTESQQNVRWNRWTPALQHFWSRVRKNNFTNIKCLFNVKNVTDNVDLWSTEVSPHVAHQMISYQDGDLDPNGRELWAWWEFIFLHTCHKTDMKLSFELQSYVQFSLYSSP